MSSSKFERQTPRHVDGEGEAPVEEMETDVLRQVFDLPGLEEVSTEKLLELDLGSFRKRIRHALANYLLSPTFGPMMERFDLQFSEEDYEDRRDFVLLAEGGVRIRREDGY